MLRGCEEAGEERNHGTDRIDLRGGAAEELRDYFFPSRSNAAAVIALAPVSMAGAASGA